MHNASIGTLSRISIGIAVFGCGGLYMQRWAIQSQIRESRTYQEAVKCLKENPEAVRMLGEPIKEKYVDIGDNNCWGRQGNISWVTVPLEGEKQSGKLHYWVEVDDVEKELFHLAKAALVIDGPSGGQILLKKDTKQ